MKPIFTSNVDRTCIASLEFESSMNRAQTFHPLSLAAVAHAALLWSWRVHRHLPCLRVRDWIRLGVDALFSIPSDKIGEMTIEF